MEQFARLPSLRDPMQKIEACHLLVGKLGIDAHHVGTIQRENEAQVVAGRCHIDVRPRLIWLGLKRELVSIFLVDVVFTKIVDRLRKRFTASSGRLQASVSTPSRPPHRTKILAPNSAPRSIARIVFCRAYARTSGSFAVKAPSRKIRMKEQRDRCHRNDQATLLAGFLEIANDCVALRARRIDWHQVIVVKVDSPGPNFRKHTNNLDRRNGRSNEIAKRITAAVSHSPVRRRICVRAWADIDHLGVSWTLSPINS